MMSRFMSKMFLLLFAAHSATGFVFIQNKNNNKYNNDSNNMLYNSNTWQFSTRMQSRRQQQHRHRNDSDVPSSSMNPLFGSTVRDLIMLHRKLPKIVTLSCCSLFNSSNQFLDYSLDVSLQLTSIQIRRKQLQQNGHHY